MPGAIFMVCVCVSLWFCLISYVFCLSYAGCVNHNIFCILTYQSLDNMDKTTDWFSLGTLLSSIDWHDITEVLIVVDGGSMAFSGYFSFL